MFSLDGKCYLTPQSDGNLVLCVTQTPSFVCWLLEVAFPPSGLTPKPKMRRYNALLASEFGENGATAAWASGTYTAAAQGKPGNYTLHMQDVSAYTVALQCLSLLPGNRLLVA